MHDFFSVGVAVSSSSDRRYLNFGIPFLVEQIKQSVANQATPHIIQKEINSRINTDAAPGPFTEQLQENISSNKFTQCSCCYNFRSLHTHNIE